MTGKEMNWREFEEFVTEFREESDRAAVILGAAKLDQIMYQILRRHLLASASASDDLLDGESPLGTFSAKINILYRLGLLDAQFVRALHLVRRIRNAFAHEVKGCTLNSGAQSDRIKELVTPFRHLAFYKTFTAHLFKDKSGASTDFRACLALMVGRLETLLENLEPIDGSRSWKLILESWDEKEAVKSVEQKKDTGG